MKQEGKAGEGTGGGQIVEKLNKKKERRDSEKKGKNKRERISEKDSKKEATMNEGGKQGGRK